MNSTLFGIEWSLRAFASMRVVRLFLRARAVINFVMRAASTSEITNGDQDQRALRKFSAIVTPSKHDNRRRGSTIPSGIRTTRSLDNSPRTTRSRSSNN